MPPNIDPAHPQTSGDWIASREEGLKRLAAFAERAGKQYAAERNYDLGPNDRHNVSVVSPYLRHRMITEREVVHEALGAHGFRAAEKFIQEVCWRTYWKGWLQQRPGVWDRYVSDVVALRDGDQHDRSIMERVERACGGSTGIACFDAWAAELVATGYLHNHARMWFASIWIYTLRLPWQLGADFFLRHLLDGDAASNTLSWRWVCGLQTKGKTYLARATNIMDFTDGRFPLTAGLATEAMPVANDVSDEGVSRIAPRQRPPRGKVALLVADDDLNPESLPFDDAEVDLVMVANPTAEASAISRKVAQFKASAIRDCSDRAERHFATRVVMLDGSGDDVRQSLTRALGDRPLVMAEMPIGFTRSQIMPTVEAVRRSGHSVTEIRRDWDDAFWPHATKGFFQLKDKIPTVLRELGEEV